MYAFTYKLNMYVFVREVYGSCIGNYFVVLDHHITFILHFGCCLLWENSFNYLALKMPYMKHFRIALRQSIKSLIIKIKYLGPELHFFVYSCTLSITMVDAVVSVGSGVSTATVYTAPVSRSRSLRERLDLEEILKIIFVFIPATLVGMMYL